MPKQTLFCGGIAGVGQGLRFGLFENKAEARKVIPDAHLPDPDEMRHYWVTEKLHELSAHEVQERLGVSRQVLSLWRKKAGLDLPRFSDHQHEQRVLRVKEVLCPGGVPRTDLTVMEVARAAKVGRDAVLEVAQQLGLTLPNKMHKRPADDEIVRLAEGRNWRQLSEACNVSMNTLRNYVYARPELALKLRERMTHEPTGGQAHGRVDVEEMVRLYEGGMNPYKLSQHFGVQQMTIIYWLKKLEIFRGGDSST